jgi:tetratricopeptide (TPR) repeat protein
MSDKEHIKSLIKEAEIYGEQGLLEQSIEKHEEALRLIQNHESYSKDKKLIDTIKSKIRTVEENLVEFDQTTDTPELSQEVEDLISRLFSFSKNKDVAAMEGAIALAKFGQYKEALVAFQRLIKEGNMPLLAAKNILMCHMTFSSPDTAIAQFRQWVSQDEFSIKDLRYIRTFLEHALLKQGIKAGLPQVAGASPEEGKPEEEEEDIIDISSVTIQLTIGPRKGEIAGFEVTFQLGNKISTIIPARQKDLADAFKPGLRLSEIQCFSSLATFIGRGIVSGLEKITSGPRRGDYSLDITIDSV